jgi:hypothetical protein
VTRVTDALYLTKQEDHRTKSGPIDDLVQPTEEINLSEEGSHPKLQNVDETRLEQQINRFKAKTGKPAKQDSSILKSNDQHNLKSAMRKNGGSSKKNNKNKEEKSNDVSSSESEISKSENPVKVSRSNYKKQGASTKNFDAQDSLMHRKRKYESGTNTDDAVNSLRKDLSESVVPVSKRSIKRSKKHDHSDNDKQVDVKKARKRKLKNRRKIESEQESESSEASSDDTISSTERDELLSKYFRKILCPILKEEREHSRQDTIDILEEKGLIDLAKKRNLINYDSMKKSDSLRDPYLEDEGFAPSDISGTTTPKKNISMANKQTERKDSFKLARTSASQERKLMGTPKRGENVIQLQKQIITSNENVDVSECDFKPEERTKSIPPIQKKNTDQNKIESAKKMLFISEKKPIFGLFGNVEKAVSNPVSLQPKASNDETKEDSTEEKKEKPVIKHLFGPSKDVIDELRKSRQSNNSSPSFGEKNSQNTSSDDQSSSDVKKPVSLFAPKTSIIKESPEEEDQASQEDGQIASNTKLTVLSAGDSDPKNPEDKTGDKQETPKKIDLKANNPFLSNDPLKAKNLFSSGLNKSSTSGPEKTVSLFNNKSVTSQGGLFGSQGKQIAPDSPASNISTPPPLFRNSSFGASPVFGNQRYNYSSFLAKPVPTKNINVPGDIDTEDVGMGNVTPPNQSPIQPSIRANMFPFNNTQKTGSIFGHQGTSGASLTSNQPKTNLFGSVPSTSAGPMFNMGAKSESKPLFSGAGATGGSMFASGPSQGQPESQKLSWSNDPFGGKKRNSKKEDDGLFSSQRR